MPLYAGVTKSHSELFFEEKVMSWIPSADTVQTRSILRWKNDCMEMRINIYVHISVFQGFAKTDECKIRTNYIIDVWEI